VHHVGEIGVPTAQFNAGGDGRPLLFVVPSYFPSLGYSGNASMFLSMEGADPNLGAMCVAL
jgi:hypothetical protein